MSGDFGVGPAPDNLGRAEHPENVADQAAKLLTTAAALRVVQQEIHERKVKERELLDSLGKQASVVQALIRRNHPELADMLGWDNVAAVAPGPERSFH